MFKKISKNNFIQYDDIGATVENRTIPALHTPKIITPISNNELHVGEGQPFMTITDAITAAQNGDTIIVHPGTFFEDVVINKDISLLALYPCLHNSRVKSFRIADEITTIIKGFEIFSVGYFAAIYIGSNVYAEITNNKIINPDFNIQDDETFYDGILIQYNTSFEGSRIVVFGNEFSHIWSCIYINDYRWASAVLIIKCNIFYDIGRVFVASPCGYAQFTRNKVSRLREYVLFGTLYAGLVIQIRDDSGENISSTVFAECNQFCVCTFNKFAFIVARTFDYNLVNNGERLNLCCNCFNKTLFNPCFCRWLSDEGSRGAILPICRRS